MFHDYFNPNVFHFETKKKTLISSFFMILFTYKGALTFCRVFEFEKGMLI